jgi:hypothetical protein
MALFLICCDNTELGSDKYKRFVVSLKKRDGSRIFHCAWVVKGEAGDAPYLYEELQPLIQPGGRLLIHEIFKQTPFDNLLLTEKAFQGLLDRFARVADR